MDASLLAVNKEGGGKDRRSYLEAGRSWLDATPSGRWLAEMEGEVQSPPPRDTGIPPKGQCLMLPVAFCRPTPRRLSVDTYRSTPPSAPMP